MTDLHRAPRTQVPNEPYPYGPLRREWCVQCRPSSVHLPAPDCVWCGGSGEVTRPWAGYGALTAFRIEVGLVP